MTIEVQAQWMLLLFLVVIVNLTHAQSGVTPAGGNKNTLASMDQDKLEGHSMDDPGRKCGDDECN